MKILGVDPGIATTGFGLIEKKSYNQYVCLDYGIIKTKPNLSDAERLTQIRNDLKELLKISKPDFIGIEELFFSQNVKTGIQVAQARGVMLELINEEQIPFQEIKPNEIKSMITGYGHAEKQQVQLMTKEILNLPEIPRPDDAADGLAVALTLGYLE